MVTCVAAFRFPTGARQPASCAQRSKRPRNQRWFAAILFCGFSGAGMADTGLLNDTGVVTFATNTSTTLSTEPFDYPGQDARMGRDAQAAAGQLTKVGSGPKGFDFTKIANNGSELPETAARGPGPTDWACTRDNVTGIVWEEKTGSGLRNRNHTFTEFDGNPATNGGSPGTASGGTCETPGRCDTEKYVQDVNAAGLCGRSDWRLPDIGEVVAFVDIARLYTDPDSLNNSNSQEFWRGVAAIFLPDRGLLSRTRDAEISGDLVLGASADSSGAFAGVRAVDRSAPSSVVLVSDPAQ